MNHEKIERFDENFFNTLEQKDKEEYFIKYIRKTLGIMEKGGVVNDN